MADLRQLATPPASVNSTGNPYDELPYDSHPYIQTHPARVAAVATLFGLNPPPVQKCRVLELGCASGGNLIPLAEAYPGGYFVGVDYSARQIADGVRVVQASGLKNVSLRHANILDIDASYGPFDYIICHGVFSWVPDAVREKILAICAEHLSPTGIAYISYNTYPGWHMRGMIRDMMRFHALRFGTAAQRVHQARALLDFLAESARNDSGPYGTLLRAELDDISGQTDAYLYHEHLEEVNTPMYFYQFAELALKHNLRYLGEARLTTMVSGNFSPDVRRALGIVATDQIQAEQYLDFVRNRTFRETLLVRASSALDWAIQPDAVRALHVTTSRRQAEDAGDVRATTPVQYNTVTGMSLSTSSPVMKATMRLLTQRWPGTVPFPELDRAAHEMIGVPSDGGKTLAVALLNTYLASDLLELRAAPIPAIPVREWPVALVAARARLSIGDVVVANSRHGHIRPNDLDRHLIPLLDGSRDRNSLLNALTELALADQISVQKTGHRLTDPVAIRETLSIVLTQALDGLAASSMLRDR